MPSSGGRSLESNVERQLGCFKQINAGGAYSCMNEAQVVRNSWSAVLNGGKRLIAVIQQRKENNIIRPVKAVHDLVHWG